MCEFFQDYSKKKEDNFTVLAIDITNIPVSIAYVDSICPAKSD